MWAFLRAIDDEEPHPRLWAFLLAASLGIGLLLKSLIAIVFPMGTAIAYLLVTHQLFSRKIWKRLHPFTGVLIVLLMAAPWYVLATVRNPPYFAFTLQSGPGQYHGFLWFFFINEQLLRFLNRRFPHDYNTVPRLYFWLFHLIWLFPWSVYFPAVAKLSFKPNDRAGRTRLLALCWAGFVLVFFTFSTTQEYYSMPCYPALALLLGSAMAANGDWVRKGTRALGVISACAALAAFAIYWDVRNLPAPGDISGALSNHPSAYTLSLGHMLDLTIPSFAYLRVPLIIAAIAALVGAIGSFWGRGLRSFLAAAVMMVVFLQAARVAMVVFDPYLSSRPLAEALLRSPDGSLITDRHYYPFSSIFFYTNRTGLLLNGRVQNLEYGSNAPGAPDVFIDDSQFAALWMKPDRYYLVVAEARAPRLAGLVGAANFHVVMQSGGKLLLTNQPWPEGTSSHSSGNVQP
jgi:4-amino-4-deoxy-L-arabinose transferase-like glycosyltransferase